MSPMTLAFVRTTCLTGAIVDALAAVQLLVPTHERMLGFEGLREPGAAGQPAIMAAILMLGFSALLLWARRSPRDRRGVVAITLAAIAGLALGNVAMGASGAAAWDALARTLAIQTMLLAIFSASAWILRGRTGDSAGDAEVES